MLQLANLHLRADTESADVAFAPGELNVVLGRNHSGKTNLLRVVAGLASTATAKVTLDGSRIDDLPARRRSVAFVMQAFVNYPHWSVRRNLESPLVAQGIAAGERRERVERVAQALRIADLLERLPGELSGGQQQRVALGRALAQEARVVLLDEPFVNLDLRLRDALVAELAELVGLTRSIVLYTTTDSRDAFTLGGKLTLLHEHQVVQQGETLDVYRAPSSVAAAELMSEPGVNRLQRADSVTVVRPEHLQLCEAQQRQFVLDVIDVETNGAASFVRGTLREAFGVALTESPEWTARLPGVRRFASGTELSLRAADVDCLSLPLDRPRRDSRTRDSRTRDRQTHVGASP